MSTEKPTIEQVDRLIAEAYARHMAEKAFRTYMERRLASPLRRIRDRIARVEKLARESRP